MMDDGWMISPDFRMYSLSRQGKAKIGLHCIALQKKGNV